DQPVEAGQRDHAGDAQEAGGAHVVAGQREAVLAGGDAAGGREVLRRGLGATRGPVGDDQRGGNEQEEKADRGGGRVDDGGGRGVHGCPPRAAAAPAWAASSSRVWRWISRSSGS